MQTLIRAILRWLFGVQALALGIALITLPRTMADGPSTPPVLRFTFLAVVALGAALSAAAWWTTRRPGPRREYLAALCCVINTAQVLWLLHYLTQLSATTIAITSLLVALNVAGLFLFLQRPVQSSGRAPQPAYRAPRDCTSRITDILFEGLAILAFWQAWRLWDRWAGSKDPTHASFGPGLVAWGLALLVMIAIHESGHALAGHLLGRELLSFTVGPFSWSRSGGRMRFKLVTPCFGGSVQTLPLETPSPRNEILVLLGGVLANLCSAPLFAWAALRLRATGPEHVYEFFYMLVVLSTVGALANLLPIRLKGDIYSDGARILQVLTHSPAIEYRHMMQRLQSTLFTPLRLRDLDPAQFQRVAVERPGDLVGLHARICAAGIFRELGKVDESNAEIAQAEACCFNCSIDLPALLHTVFILHHATVCRDARAARLWWNRMSRKKFDQRQIDVLASGCSLAWIEGRAADAETLWHQADTVARALPHFYKSDRECVALLRTLLDGPPQPLVIPGTAPDEIQPKATPWLNPKQALLVACATIVLLAASIVPSGYPQSLFWHATHGNQAPVGDYRVTLPPKWHPESSGRYTVATFTKAGDAKGARISAYQAPGQDETEKQQTDDLADVATDMAQDTDNKSVQFVLKTTRFNFYCVRSQVTTSSIDPYESLDCSTNRHAGSFLYDGPASLEPEARSIFTSLH